MNTRFSLRCLIVGVVQLAISAMLPMAAFAQAQLSTLGITSAFNSDHTSGIAMFSNYNSYGIAFTTDNQGYVLGGFDLGLQRGATGSLVATLYTYTTDIVYNANTSSVTLSAPLASFNFTGFTPVSGIYGLADFQPTATYTLAPNQDYLIAVYAPSGVWTPLYTLVSDGYANPSGNSWVLHGEAAAIGSVGSGSWSVGGNESGSAPTHANGYAYPYMELNASVIAAVPEPATTGLICGLVAPVVLLAVRRKRQGDADRIQS